MNLATSMREPIEPSNKVHLAFIWENFLPCAINEIGWLLGHQIFSDGMTNDNKTSAALLLREFREGTYPRHPDSIIRITEHFLALNGDDVG